MNATAQKPDLTAVTPTTGRKVELPEYDTSTPVDQDVMPFSMIYMMKWRTWLMARMKEHWAHITEFNFNGIVAQHASQNGCMFIKAKRAILLATATRDALETRPVVKIIFCFKFHPENEDEDKDVRLLLRRVEEWANSQGAKEIRIENLEAFDMTRARLKNDFLKGESATYLVKGLDK